MQFEIADCRNTTGLASHADNIVCLIACLCKHRFKARELRLSPGKIGNHQMFPPIIASEGYNFRSPFDSSLFVSARLPNRREKQRSDGLLIITSLSKMHTKTL